ncbi:hypothetical protein fh0823_19950 [Francisella halioticida]|nr:hypothetical protein [Francisella halioticida]BCD91856.1 hypothetical protein fh0823_19950 [Francisella halioticida]
MDSKGNIANIVKAFASSWAIFAYLVAELILGFVYENITSYDLFILVFIVISAGLYIVLVNQRDYCAK